MRENHGVDEAEALAQARRHRIREGGENVRPEEERARGGERQIETFEQPKRHEGLHGEAARKGIQAEERCELVDGSAGGAQSAGLRGCFLNLGAGEARIE
jgi:hypothetical protein